MLSYGTIREAGAKVIFQLGPIPILLVNREYLYLSVREYLYLWFIRRVIVVCLGKSSYKTADNTTSVRKADRLHSPRGKKIVKRQIIPCPSGSL